MLPVGTGVEVSTGTAAGVGAGAGTAADGKQSVCKVFSFQFSVFRFSAFGLQFSLCAVICHLLGGFMFRSLIVVVVAEAEAVNRHTQHE